MMPVAFSELLGTLAMYHQTNLRFLWFMSKIYGLSPRYLMRFKNFEISVGNGDRPIDGK
jgi:hypothetical protein